MFVQLFSSLEFWVSFKITICFCRKRLSLAAPLGRFLIFCIWDHGPHIGDSQISSGSSSSRYFMNFCLDFFWKKSYPSRSPKRRATWPFLVISLDNRPRPTNTSANFLAFPSRFSKLTSPDQGASYNSSVIHLGVVVGGYGQSTHAEFWLVKFVVSVVGLSRRLC